MIGMTHMTLYQAILGISTLVMMVPVPLASAHQAGALTLLSLGEWMCFSLPVPVPVKESVWAICVIVLCGG